MDFDFNARRRPMRLEAIPVATDPNADKHIMNIKLSSNAFSQTADFDSEDSSTIDAEAVAASNTPGSYSKELEPFMYDSNDPSKSNGGGKMPKEEGSGPWYKRWASSVIPYIKNHQRASIIVASVVVLAITGGVSYALTRPNKPLPSAAKVEPKLAKPVPITSPLTGLEVSADDTKRPTISVMIENTVFARPQSGLKEAGVVYEAIAEAGITRFLAIYQEGKPGNIGPVRSSRPYYVDWARGFDAMYSHAGGSPDALAKIKADGAKDLDQFANPDFYRRISTRQAPHNLYTDIGQLSTASNQKGWTTSKFTSWPRKKEIAADKRTIAGAITASQIDMNISGPTYNSHYDYVLESNSYKRSEGGEGHIDAESKEQLSPKVVIALIVPYALEADGYHSNYQLDGTGSMVVFQDGVATKGTWTRTNIDTAGAAAQYEFSDEAGQPLKLNAGQTWLTVLGDASAVTYAP